MTGDVYYEQKGKLRTYSKGAKIFLGLWSALILFSAISNLTRYTSSIMDAPEKGQASPSTQETSGPISTTISNALAAATGREMSLTELWPVHFPNEPGTSEVDVIESKVLYRCKAAGRHDAVFGYVILKNIFVMGAHQVDAKPYAVFLGAVQLGGGHSEALVGIKDLFFTSMLIGKTVLELAPEVLDDLRTKGCEIPKHLADEAKLAVAKWANAKPARHASVPTFSKGEDYGLIRKTLIAGGWQAFTAADADTCANGDDRCVGRPEMQSCAGSGQAPCKFTWTRGSDKLAICTIGEQAVFYAVCDF